MALVDQVGNIGRAQHHFGHRNQPIPHAGHQALGNHAVQVHRQVEQDASMRIVGEKAQHALNRLVGIVGVHGRNAQVPGFGVVQGVLQRLEVAQLANHDHVGRLPHGVAQCIAKRLRVHPHLALANDGLFMRMHEFDRVFDRQNVARPVVIAVVQHGCQRGGLARPGRPDDEHQAAFEQRQLTQHQRHLELFQ